MNFWMKKLFYLGEVCKKVRACYSALPLHCCALASGAKLVIVPCTAAPPPAATLPATTLLGTLPQYHHHHRTRVTLAVSKPSNFLTETSSRSPDG